MAVREVLRMGTPSLFEVSLAIAEFDNNALHDLVADMFDTMALYSGAGLAAPQIGINKRLVIFGVEKNPRYPDVEVVPTTVLINPEIEFLSDEGELGWEGCLSVPGMRGAVERCTQIRYRGYDQYGQEIVREAEGFHARVVQHEVDHLDGVLYPMRIDDMTLFGFEKELFPEKTEE
ncbi:MAG: peptide deformylase [Gammaproteobacteria bacterium]|nr:peptide deformylase [Gammaproteobacteria bacterium]PCH64422.1 MAG: peptide deformylase [Gammaproteobacteria bacterium]